MGFRRLVCPHFEVLLHLFYLWPDFIQILILLPMFRAPDLADIVSGRIQAKDCSPEILVYVIYVVCCD